MHGIHCPHCGTAFKIDESGYADILKQVKTTEFEQELHERLALAEREKHNALELAKANAASELQRAAAAKQAEITELRARLNAGDVERKLAVNEAVSAIQKQRDDLAHALEQAKREQQAATELAKAQLATVHQQTTASKDAEIQALRSQLSQVELSKQLAIAGAVSTVEKERDALRSSVSQAELEKQLAEKSLKDKYETLLKDRDEAIERLRDMKARLSTKMVGETLEQHCETEFNCHQEAQRRLLQRARQRPYRKRLRVRHSGVLAGAGE